MENSLRALPEFTWELVALNSALNATAFKRMSRGGTRNPDRSFDVRAVGLSVSRMHSREDVRTDGLRGGRISKRSEMPMEPPGITRVLDSVQEREWQ